jgi:hypothetical protein
VTKGAQSEVTAETRRSAQNPTEEGLMMSAMGIFLQ